MTDDVLDGANAAAAAEGGVATTSRPAKRVRTRLVDIAFTPEQIAYLDERMRIVTEARPMRRAGGTSLGHRCREGLIVT